MRRIGGERCAAGFDARAEVMGVDVAEDGGLDAAEGEVEVRAFVVLVGAFLLVMPSREVAVFDLGEGEGDGAGVAVGGEGVDPGAAGVAEAEELGDLVVGFAGGVVDRAAYVAVGPGAIASLLLGEVEMGVAAGDDEGEQREFHRGFGALARLHQDGVDVAFEVVDGDQRACRGRR